MTERTASEYVRAEEAARLIGVSERTIWRWSSAKAKEKAKEKAKAGAAAPFPKPIPLSRTVTVFSREEILNFVKARAGAS